MIGGDVLRFSLCHVDFKWWVLPVDIAHPALRFFVLTLANGYFSY